MNDSIAPAELQRFCSALLQAQNLKADDADYVAASLVAANLRGTDSHGVARLPHYIRRLRAGSITARPRMKIVQSKKATAVLDGGAGLGQMVNRRACEIAAARADKYGAGWVAIKNSSHGGALAFFGHQLACENKIAILFSHVDQLVLPYGAKQPFHGTNPLCIAVPGAKDEVFCLDMATSIVPWNVIENAKTEGRALPRGVAVDADGNETLDPQKVSALHAFGAQRGSGLGLAIDLLCSMLSGAPFGPHIPMMYGDLTKPRKLGGLVGALDIAAFCEVDVFKKRVSQWMKEIRALPSMSEAGVLVPDDREKTEEKARRKSGISLPREVTGELNGLGEAAGIKPLKIKPTRFKSS